MGNVVEFKRTPDDPHLQGPAQCLHCKHVWEAVAPAGEVCLECPACGLQRGTWNLVVHALTREHWACRCDCVVFAITPTGALCCKCGRKHSFAAMAES